MRAISSSQPVKAVAWSCSSLRRPSIGSRLSWSSSLRRSWPVVTFGGVSSLCVVVATGTTLYQSLDFGSCARCHVWRLVGL